MYHLERTGCPSGYAYVVDYMGNKMYYGSISDCKQCIDDLNNTNTQEVQDD